MELVAESGLRRIARGGRGEPDPRPRERDGGARGRAGGERARRADPLDEEALDRVGGLVEGVPVDVCVRRARRRSPGAGRARSRYGSIRGATVTSVSAPRRSREGTRDRLGRHGWLRHLAPGADDGAGSEPVAQAPVVAGHEVLGHLLVQERARGVEEAAGRVALLDRLLDVAKERSALSASARSSAIGGGTQMAGSSRRPRSTRSGDAADSSITRRPPKLWPIHAAAPMPARPPSRAGHRGAPWKSQGGSHSERPWPRRSSATTRNRAASLSSASLRKVSAVTRRTPCRQTTAGASGLPHWWASTAQVSASSPLPVGR